jgi:queuosine precursor transporter
VYTLLPVKQAMNDAHEYHIDRRGIAYAILVALYVTLILLTNTVGTKLFVLSGVVFPVSLFCFPFTFLITDIVSDVFGAKQAQLYVVIGFVASVILLLFAMFGLWVPPAPTYNLASSYNDIFGPTWRLFFASMTAYLVAQTIDVHIFHWIKSRTGDRHLWLRNNASTMISQFIDTGIVLFIFLYNNEAVFLGSLTDLWNLVLSVYVAKIIIAALDTPFCYLGIYWTRRFLDVKNPSATS